MRTGIGVIGLRLQLEGPPAHVVPGCLWIHGNAGCTTERPPPRGAATSFFNEGVCQLPIRYPKSPKSDRVALLLGAVAPVCAIVEIGTGMVFPKASTTLNKRLRNRAAP